MNDVFRFAHEAMATTFEVLIAGQEEEYAHQVSLQVFKQIDRIEGLFSRFRPDSEIAMANRLQPGEHITVTLETFEVLQLAARVNRETGGAFDVTFARGAAGSGMQRLALIREQGSGGLGVGLLPAAESAREHDPGPCIDLGAIGKGFALDCVRELLADWDVEHALIHSGTSTALAIGHMNGSSGGWPVGSGSIWGEAAGLGTVHLHNHAISGSGTEVKGHHIVDPRTGLPAAPQLAAWVIAPSAAESDALSTAFFVMSTQEVRAYCENHPEIGAMVVPAAGDQTLLTFGAWPSR